jgi:hypothetical protein
MIKKSLTRFIFIEKFPASMRIERGVKIWSNKNNMPHSVKDRPAIIKTNGTKEWYKNGDLHRDNDLPAIVKFNGTLEWYKNGKKHRDGDRPSYISEVGTMAWFYEGNYVNRGEGIPCMISNGCFYFKSGEVDARCLPRKIELEEKVNLAYERLGKNKDELKKTY